MNVLVVEDHPLFKEALVNTVQRLGLEARCCSAGTAAQARHLAAQDGPFHMALVDQRLPDGEGLRLLAELAPRCRIRVLLTGLDEPGLAHQARQLGLQGYLPKSMAPDAMVQAMRRLISGETWFPSHLPAAPPPLSDRQLQVLRAVGQGRSNREIAAELGIGERTVKDHLSVIFVRLGAGNRAEAVAQASAMGLLLFDSRQ